MRPTPKPALVSTPIKVPSSVKSSIISCGNVDSLTALKAASISSPHIHGDE